MSFEVSTALIQTYKSNITIKFQQKGSKLRPYVREEPQSAEFDFYDRIGPVEAVEVTNRHADTPLISTPHDRRRVALRDFDWADLIDKKDKIRLLEDPTSSYVVNGAYALGRSLDRVIITAATAVAYIGKTGAETVAFPAASEVAVDYVETGVPAESNLTIGKLRRVRAMLDKAEAAPEGEADLVAVCGPDQKQALLRTTEATSSDYNVIKALVNGEIDTFMGFRFVWHNMLTVVAGITDCLFWEKQGMLAAIGMDITVDVGPRRDKRNSTQVYVCGSFGGSRMWEEKVIRVKCNNAK